VAVADGNYRYNRYIVVNVICSYCSDARVLTVVGPASDPDFIRVVELVSV